MFWIILGVVLGWMFLKFMINFVLPVYRATRQVRQQFGQMRQPSQPKTEPQPKTKYTPKKEYIDFEEVK